MTKSRSSGPCYRHSFNNDGLDDPVSLLAPDANASDLTIETCPHGGVGTLPGGYPRCGLCLIGIYGTPEESSYHHFLRVLNDVAKHTVWHLRRRDSLFGWSVEDAISECLALLVLNPKNLESIIDADDPIAMAHRVAHRRLLTALSRDPHRKLVHLEDDPPKSEEGLTAEEKLENLNHQHNGRPYTDDDGDFFFTFPHFTRVVNRETMKRLARDMEDGFALLQKQTPIGRPFDVCVAIKLRHGGYGDKPYTWRQLVDWCNGNTHRKQTRDQVRYAVENGEAFIKKHILKIVLAVTEGQGVGVGS